MSRRRREAMAEMDDTRFEVEAEGGTNLSLSNQSRGRWHTLSGTQRCGIIAVIAFISMGVLGAGLKYLEDSAGKQKNPQESQNFLARLNPFVPLPTPTPTPLPLSKQYIYAGSRLLAVKDAGVDVAAPSDLAVWRPSSGVWWVLGSSSQVSSQQWGLGADIAAPGDFDGDGKTDFCVFRPSDGNWYTIKSSDGSYYITGFGLNGDKPAQADYDGDGKTDMAIFRPSNNAWYILQSSNSQTFSTTFGTSGDEPTPADYDGDGKSDVGVWRSSSAAFWIIPSTTGEWAMTTFGAAGDKPAVGDYDGDGRADLATWRGSDNKWRILQSTSGQTITIEWGVQSTDKAVQSDYDADGKCDIAVWRASGTYTGYWFILKSSNGQMRMELWGQAGDIPVPNRYRR